MKKRNGEIDLLRFIFCIFIFLYHFHDRYTGFVLCSFGYIGVAFFFIVSGVLMSQSIVNNNTLQNDNIGRQTWDFILRKIRVFYKYYVFEIIIIGLVIYEIILKHQTLSGVISMLLKSIPTFFLVFLGLNWDNRALYVGGSWYLSAMIIAMLILYPFAVKYKNVFTKVVCPIIALFLLGYIETSYGGLKSFGKWMGITRTGIIIAIAEIALGAFLYWVASFIKRKYEDSNHKKVFSIAVFFIKWGAFLISFIYAMGVFDGFKDGFDIHVLLFISIGVTLSFSDVGIVIKENKISNYLGQLSLPIYIFHIGIMNCILCIIPSETVTKKYQLVLLILLILLVSVVLKHLVDNLFKALKWDKKRI